MLPRTVFGGIIRIAALAPQQVEAGPPPPKVYAYCVEVGVPKSSRAAPQNWPRCSVRSASTGRLPDPDRTPARRDSAGIRRAGLKVYLLQTAINLAPKAAARYDAQVPAAIRKLKGRPVTVVVTLAGLKPGDPAGMEPAIQALRELGDAAAEAGVRISLYNHVSCWNESVPFNVELVRKVNHPQVGFNFNVCHWLKVEGNKDYRPLLRANADKLFCVTICGADRGQRLDQRPDPAARPGRLRQPGAAGHLARDRLPGPRRDHVLRHSRRRPRVPPASMKTWKAWTAQP